MKRVFLTLAITLHCASGSLIAQMSLDRIGGADSVLLE
jgi:hypothetical protein